MMEHGISDRMQQHLLPVMPNCANPNAFYSASLSDLATAYIFMLIGMGVGLISGLCLDECLDELDFNFDFFLSNH